MLNSVSKHRPKSKSSTSKQRHSIPQVKQLRKLLKFNDPFSNAISTNYTTYIEKSSLDKTYSQNHKNKIKHNKNQSMSPTKKLKPKANKKIRYFEQLTKSIQKKQSFQPTPILTPLVSQRNSNNPATLREMQSINKKQNQKLGLLKNYLENDTLKISYMKKKTKEQTVQQYSKSNVKINNKIKQQIQNTHKIIEQSSKNYKKLVQQHRYEVDYLHNQINTINKKLKYQINKSIILEDELHHCEQQIKQSKNIIEHKDNQIKQMMFQNYEIKQQNQKIKKSVSLFQSKISQLECNINDFQEMRVVLENKLETASREKNFLQENTTQILGILRNNFGKSFANITKEPQFSKQYFIKLNKLM